jgi:hypothetical protein
MLDYSYRIDLEELFKKTIEVFGFQALTPRASALCIAVAHEIVVEKGAAIQGKIIIDLIPPTIPNPNH